jgi:hypothetical protein
MSDWFPRIRQDRAKSVCAILVACVTWLTFVGGPAAAAQKTASKAGVAAESPMSEAPPLARDLPPRQVEVVVVWGFRFRPTEHDLRMSSVRSGYGELSEKAVCVTAICGFVVMQEGGKWKATNVVAASETQLRDMQSDLERTGTTLVIVHPNGTKRNIPNF